MRNLIWAFPLWLATAAPALAQAAAPGTIATARAVVSRLQIERTLDPMFEQVTPLAARSVVAAFQNAADTPPALKARLATDAGRAQVSAIITEEYIAAFRARYPDIKAGMAEEYSKRFTEPELLRILAFYDSPAGSKMLALQPELQKALSEQGRGLGREAGLAALPKIQARVTALDAPARR